MNRTVKKKAFTLVELLVVITILAILATISIVGFASFTKKASISNDSALISQVNEILFAEETLGNVPNTMHEAREMILDGEYGIDIAAAKISTKGYHLGYDIKQNKVVLLKSLTGTDIVESPDNYTLKPGDELNIFVVRKDGFGDNNCIFSEYAADSVNVDQITTSRGFDNGSAKINTITYKNTNGKAQDVVIRTTSSQNLIVEAKNDKDDCDTVNHYGDANSVNIISNGLSSYHEFGGSLKTNVCEGAYVAETDSIVSYLSLAGNNGDVQVTLNTDSVNGKVEVLENDGENKILVNGLAGSFTTELVGSSNLADGSSFEMATLNYNSDNDDNGGLIKANHFAGIAAPSSDLNLEDGGCLNKETNEYEHAWLTKEHSTVLVCERCGAYKYTIVIEENQTYTKEATYAVNYITDNEGNTVKQEEDFPQISYNKKNTDDVNPNDPYESAKSWIECVDNSYSLIGFGSKDDPYLLSSPRDLAFVAYKVNNGLGNFAGAYYSITQDIDLSNKGWVPIGTFRKPFHGYIEGNNHKIIGLSDMNLSNADNIFMSKVFGINCEVYGLIAVVGNGDFVAQNIFLKTLILI